MTGIHIIDVPCNVTISLSILSEISTFISGTGLENYYGSTLLISSFYFNDDLTEERFV